jgi:ribosomal protein S18 acetylase RimI-like enzyme
MAPEIRSARASDVDALVAVEQAVFDTDRISRRAFHGLTRSGSAAVLIAEDAGSAIGCCVVLSRAGSRKARLYSIGVLPGRSGIGRALLAAAEDAARARGATAMRLEVREDNRRAIRLYEQSGYRPFDSKPDYYADGATALRFQKPLDGGSSTPQPLARQGTPG